MIRLQNKRFKAPPTKRVMPTLDLSIREAFYKDQDPYSKFTSYRILLFRYFSTFAIKKAL